MELVERELIDSPLDVEARAVDDDELSARDLEEIDARDIAEFTVDLEAREPFRKRRSRPFAFSGPNDPKVVSERRRRAMRKIYGRRKGRGRRGRNPNRRNGGRSGAPSPSPGPSGGGYPPGPPTPGPPEDPPAITTRSIFRKRNRATTPLNEKQQARVASLDKACNAIGNKKSNKKCKGLVNRLRKNMSDKNSLVAEITKMTTTAPAAQ